MHIFASQGAKNLKFGDFEMQFDRQPKSRKKQTDAQMHAIFALFAAAHNKHALQGKR